MFFNWTLLPLIYRSKNHIKIEEFPTTLLICGFYFENGVLGVAKNSKRQNIQELPLLATLLTAHHFCLKFSLIVGKIFLTLRIYLSWIPADDLTQHWYRRTPNPQVLLEFKFHGWESFAVRARAEIEKVQKRLPTRSREKAVMCKSQGAGSVQTRDGENMPRGTWGAPHQISNDQMSNST